MFQHVHRVLACQYPDTPPLLKSMLHTAELYGIDFIDIKLSREVQGQMSTWSHPGEKKGERNRNNTSIALCLQNNHGVQKVEDLLKIQLRLDSEYHDRRAENCQCLEYGIWVLTGKQTPSHRKIHIPRRSLILMKADAPSLSGSLEPAQTKAIIMLYSGGGLWFTASSQWNQSICLPKLVAQTTQNGVLYSILWAIETVPAHTKLLFEAENQHASQQLCKKLELWENTGFVGLDNGKILEAIATRL
ncbi:hypothetical protein C8J56DRAFT_897334 [Mycena floridula]|nr:hypothetical protein C8J56DRAFT_897334 [Mycena floridula]